MKKKTIKSLKLKDIKHFIDFILEKNLSYESIYNLSVWKLEVLWKYLNSVLDKKWIMSSWSLVDVLILFIFKKNNFLCLYVDYCGLNALTIKNYFPLSLIGETIDQLVNTKIFIQLDLQDVYHWICIRRGNEWKTVFRTCYNYYKYYVMSFNLINIPATFQAYINHVMVGLLDIICVMYLDDILIYSSDLKNHMKYI